MKTIDLETQHHDMVQHPLHALGVHDRRIPDAMLRVPRERFLPEDMQEFVYGDSPLPIAVGQTVS
ncbi:protein-L-isoaspartate O-methyltransferase [Rubripirellula lacrimiformis]|uniref:Protein-L-isoaspartate O-methyltransferase n=1 Tax=Rubripirellula lacrimiformis TaxID=1930273 RepID=A0A517N489_9BACT|nr:hypothetical protein [Rubripirellula lacrimiformis]QDT01947.1 protein-L-isoaspartate O-methyltransferase [Rubripirellula lacrimiformis]